MRPGAREAHGDKISAARRKLHEDRVDPNRELPTKERAKLVDNSLRAEMAKLALASAKARRRDGPPEAA
jgi:hypothetical protein